MKKISFRLFGVIIIALLFYILAGWKIPILWHMEGLELPEGCKTVYRTKIRISDVYWLHIEGEKVIQCDIGYEAAKAYIEEHNSEETLRDMSVYAYGGMSDIAIYDSQYDEMFWQQPDQEKYIVLHYFRKL